jgi:hypothetical protein
MERKEGRKGGMRKGGREEEGKTSHRLSQGGADP